MIKMCAIVLTFFAVGFFSGCHSRQPVVVRVFRDSHSPVGRELDHRFNDLNATRPKLPSGRRILIATVDSQDYKEMLREKVGTDVRPQLIVLNSMADEAANPILKRESDRAVNICGAARTCPAVVPAFVPSWVADAEEVEGAQAILKALLNMAPLDRPGIVP